MNRGGPMNRGGGASMSRGGNRGHPNQVGLEMIIVHLAIQFVLAVRISVALRTC